MNVIQGVDDRMDILSEVLSFCGGSYGLAGCVSNKWNQVYKMRNKSMNTQASQCITIESMEEFIIHGPDEWSPSTMGKLFKSARMFKTSNQQEMIRCIHIKKIFLDHFRWMDQELIQFAKECVDINITLDVEVQITEYIMEIMESIVDNANRFNRESVMFGILEMYYNRFPSKRGLNVFTSKIATFRTLGILKKYVELYEFGEFDHSIITSTNREDIIKGVSGIKRRKRNSL